MPPPPQSNLALTLSMMLNILHCNINIFKLLVHSLHFFYVKNVKKQNETKKVNQVLYITCWVVFKRTAHFLSEKSPKLGAISRYFLYI